MQVLSAANRPLNRPLKRGATSITLNLALSAIGSSPRPARRPAASSAANSANGLRARGMEWLRSVTTGGAIISGSGVLCFRQHDHRLMQMDGDLERRRRRLDVD